jgi:hypothetical protein
MTGNNRSCCRQWGMGMGWTGVRNRRLAELGLGALQFKLSHIEALARPLLLLERAEVQHVSASLCRLTEKSF